MEIITGVERRRQWRDEEKLRILGQLDEPGAKFGAVARRHDISRGLLWQWRDAQRRGRLVAETPGFVPLQVVPELPAPEAREGSGPTPRVIPAREETDLLSLGQGSEKTGIPPGRDGSMSSGVGISSADP